MYRRHSLRLVAAAILTLVVSLLPVIGGPSPAMAAEGDQCQAASAAGGPTAASEHAASALATACDLTVEVLAYATDSTKVFALPSGEFSFESWAAPRWTKRDGSWVEIDTRLVVGGDGLVRPVASLADVVFSAGGEAPFARMSGAGRSSR